MPRYFTEEHEWIDVDGETATIGITDYAQEQLGDIVFVEVPQAGAEPCQGQGSRGGRKRQGGERRLRARSAAP